jgi:hypothetical protein
MAVEGSLTHAITQLQRGERIVHTRIVPEVSPASIAEAKNRLRANLSQPIDRAKLENPGRRYTGDTFHLITPELYAIVLFVITRTE